MSGSPIGMMRRGGEPGASSAPAPDQGNAFVNAMRARTAGAPASNEAPRPAVAAAPAPERKGGGIEVRGLEARYDEIVDEHIRAQGREADTKLIKSAALAKKESFVVSAMAEPTSRVQALSRRIDELVGLDNAELAKIANEPVPEAAPEAAVETAPEIAPSAEAAVEAVPETKSEAQMQLEDLASVEGLGDPTTGIDTAKLEEIVVSALGNTKTDWSKVDDGFLEAVGKVLEDLKADKQQPAPEYPFLKVNRINGALEAIRQEQKRWIDRQTAINKALEDATRIARGGEAAPVLTDARETATRIAGGETAPTAAREMSEDEKLAHMKTQFKIKDNGLNSLILKLDDYLTTAGIFGGLKAHTRDLKRQIRDLKAEQDKLSRAIYDREHNPNKPGITGRPKDSQARDESITKPTEKSPL